MRSMSSRTGPGRMVRCLAGGVLLMQAGCSLAPLLRPLPPETSRDATIPATLGFTMADGTILPARAWLPPPGVAQRGTILALHGYTDSRDCFEIPGPAFAAAGYAVYAPDQRGFGASASRGTWPGTEALVADAATLVGQLRARHPGLPVIVAGESMGGAVAALLAARPGPAPDATVLLAPAVWGWPQLPTSIAATLRVANALAPGWSPDPSRVPTDLLASDNIDALIRFGRDPLTLRAPSVHMTKGLVDLMTAAQSAMPALHGRVLYAAGVRDRLIPAHATAAAWARLPPGVRRAAYPNGYHLLLRDTDRALVLADILTWLDAPDTWLPSGADAAAVAWQAGAPWQGTPSTALPSTWASAWQRPIWPY